MSRGETTTTYFSRPHGARLGAHSRSLSRDTNMTASAQAMDCSRLTPRRRAVADVYTACVETHLRGYDVCYVIAQAPQPVSPYPRTCAPVRNRIHRAPYAHARPRSSHTRSVRKAAPPCWCRPVRCTMHETGAPQTCCTSTPPARQSIPAHLRTTEPHTQSPIRTCAPTQFAHAACAQSRASMLVPSGPVHDARDQYTADMLHTQSPIRTCAPT